MDEKKTSTLFIAVFFLAFFVRLWFNFIDIHPNAAFAFDAAEYLRYAQNIDQVFSCISKGPFWSATICAKTLFGQASLAEAKQLKDILEPLHNMSIAGPVFPAFIFASCKILGKCPSFESWALPIVLQCFLTALVPVLIMAIGNDCWNKRTGIIAGFLAAIYPGFIVGSGRLYSESFACVLLCFVLWLFSAYLIKNRNDFSSAFWLGAILFALQMTRSIMFVLSLAIFLFLGLSVLISDRKRPIIKYMLGIITGFIVFLSPWLGIQKFLTGKASLVVDRVSNYNLLVGNDVDGLGWLSIPYQNCSNTNNENYLHIMKFSIANSPWRWFKLMLDKPARMFKMPWNDFKTSVGCFSLFDQTIFHQIILAFALIGFIILYFQFGQMAERKKLLARSFILLVFLLHFVYLFFITLPRYALTAMPEVILFAAAGFIFIIEIAKEKMYRETALKTLLAIGLLILVGQLNLSQFAFLRSADFRFVQLSLVLLVVTKILVLLLLYGICFKIVGWHKKRRQEYFAYRSAIIAAIASICLVLPSYCLPLRVHGRCFEWSTTFDKSGQIIKKNICLSNDKAKLLCERGGYLAVNLENGSSLAACSDIFINDFKINAPMIPAMSLYQDLNLVTVSGDNIARLEQEFIFRCLCDVSAKNPGDLRQWYLMPVTPEDWRRILRQPVDRVPISPAPSGNARVHLNLIVEKKDNSPTKIYGGIPAFRSFYFMPSLDRFSWEKAFYSVESESGISDPSYDQKITGELKNESNKDNAGTELYFKVLIPRASKKCDSPILLRENQSKSCTLPSSLSFTITPNLFLTGKREDICLIRLKGYLKHDSSKNLLLKPSVHFQRSTDGKSEDIIYEPVWASNTICSSNFDICFPLSLSAFSAVPNKIELIVDGKEAKNVKSLARNDDQVNCELSIYSLVQKARANEYDVF